jgi:hypothetical protein
LLDRERLVSWSIVMVQNQIVGLKRRSFEGTATFGPFNIST